MQVLLTLTAELLVVVVAGAMVFDFLAGLLHLYTSIPTPQGKQKNEPLEDRATEPTPTAYKETAMATASQIARQSMRDLRTEYLPANSLPKGAGIASSTLEILSPDSCRPVVEDPWESEVEVMTLCFYCHDEIAPTIYLLPPAMPEVIDQHGRQGVEGTSTQLPPETVDYSWTIRALKKEAQRRQLKRYSSLTKSQLITALTAL